jgi:glutamate-1-semialdehyde 2,1-aminomutase
MNTSSFALLWKELADEYEARFQKSGLEAKHGGNYFPNGSAQGGRVFEPFPPVCCRAKGSCITTIDEVELIDFWLGHFVMLRGHSPEDQRATALTSINNMEWFQTGQVGHLEAELAESLSLATNTESVLFAAGGAQATAAACMIARASTSRPYIVKAIGGWHGVQPWSTISVSDSDAQECLGMPASVRAETIAVSFNDCQRLEEVMREYGDQVAAIILEPVLGNAGMIIAELDYLRSARLLSNHYGSCLILDEIVTGFRVRPGPMSVLYGIQPDLIVIGKSISGGMPFAALCGRRQLFDAVSKRINPRVLADLGTFTGHPGTLSIVLNELRHLIEIPSETYAELCNRSATLRESVAKTLQKEGIFCAATGRSQETAIPDFPIGTIRFTANNSEHEDLAQNPNIHWDPNVLDIRCRMTVSKVLLMIEGIYSWQGIGAMSFIHSDEDVRQLSLAYENIAPRLRQFIVSTDVDRD